MNNDELTNVNLMTNEKLQKIYDFMKENKEVVHDIYSDILKNSFGTMKNSDLLLSSIRGPYSNLKEGKKVIAPSSEDIKAMKKGDPKIMKQYWDLVGTSQVKNVMNKTINRLTNNDDPTKNEQINYVFSTMAELYRVGLLEVWSYDDEVTGLNNYSANKDLTEKLVGTIDNDSKIITSFENPLEIYSKLPVNVGNRGENQIREKAIDGIVTELFNYKMQQKTK